MAFKRQVRISGSKTFAQIFKSTRPQTEGPYTIRVLRVVGMTAKFAVIVPSSTLPLASKRNALRRHVTEMLRRIISMHPVQEKVQAIITVRDAHKATGPQSSERLMSLLKKSGILR